MESDPMIDHVRELRGNYRMLPESAPTKFVTVLPAVGWRAIGNADTSITQRATCDSVREVSKIVPVAAMPDATPDTGPKADYHGPDDAAHRAVHDVTEHLLNSRVTNQKARAGLRDALDKADKPSTGRKASDQAIGRALRFIAPHIGLRTL